MATVVSPAVPVPLGVSNSRAEQGSLCAVAGRDLDPLPQGMEHSFGCFDLRPSPCLTCIPTGQHFAAPGPCFCVALAMQPANPPAALDVQGWEPGHPPVPAQDQVPCRGAVLPCGLSAAEHSPALSPSQPRSCYCGIEQPLP